MAQSNILFTLKRKNPHNITALKKIYNARQKSRMKYMARISQMQHFLKKLYDPEYIDIQVVLTVTKLKDYLGLSSSIKLLCTFSYVLLMDYTYNMNRYCLSILQSIGITSTDMNFLVYLQFEHKNNYTWALHKLRNLMYDQK